ncbi:hypothetical protein EYF80_056659 [Liparis tanakae]|uniref:Uncharacterized protein n=1 Tax=Liparis tanakae TaxID=230148 RepID=A0A4Z2EWC3_9TELE|nr:hypothetical protein EYF80_056659 [Liparis tanakae]
MSCSTQKSTVLWPPSPERSDLRAFLKLRCSFQSRSSKTPVKTCREDSAAQPEILSADLDISLVTSADEEERSRRGPSR